MIGVAEGRHPLIPRPLRLNEFGTGSLQILIMVSAIVRGIDYSDGNISVNSPALSVVEKAAPLYLWGMTILLFAAVIAVGSVFGNLIAVSVGHGVIGAVYLALAVGQGAVVLEEGHSWEPGRVEIIGTIVAVVSVAALWLLREVIKGRGKASWPELFRCLRRGWRYDLLVAAGVYAILTLTLSTDGIRTASGLAVAGGIHLLLAKAAQRLHDVDDSLAALPPGDPLRSAIQ